jgi:hypothetical protein
MPSSLSHALLSLHLDDLAGRMQYMHTHVTSHLIEGYNIHKDLITRREPKEQAIAAKKDKALPDQPLQYAREYEVQS